MKKTIHKLFWVWNFDKEEKWLNEMSAIGLRLTNVSFGRYDFEEGAPGEYIYRLELLKNFPTHPESERYIRFIEETGAEHVSSFKKWVYFRKKSGDDGFDLYSDVESRLNHLKKVRGVIFFCFFILISWFLYCIAAVWMLLRERGASGTAAEFTQGFNAGFIVTAPAAVLFFSIWLGKGYLRVRKKIKELEKERKLHE